jgi:hypothetical protein
MRANRTSDGSRQAETDECRGIDVDPGVQAAAYVIDAVRPAGDPIPAR